MMSIETLNGSGECDLEPGLSVLLNPIITALESEPGIFTTPARLFEMGMFRSHAKALEAIKGGLLPSVRVSPNRTLIPKAAVVRFFRDSLIASMKNSNTDVSTEELCSLK